MAAPLMLLAAGPALASGGAHVVDDAAVETPGLCHAETWAGFSSHGAGMLNIGPGCTRRAWRNLELGGFLTHSWTRESSDTVAGLSTKLALRGEETGLGVAITGSVGYGFDHDHVEMAAVVVPVTIPAGEHLRVNLNLGWHWFHDDRAHDVFAGAQIEYQLSPRLGLMAEGFARDRDKAGGQVGLRWTDGGGNIDLDLIAGRYVDGTTPTTVTIGLTIRG